MERQMERRREPEPATYSRVLEELQAELQAREQQVAALPHVRKYQEVPWQQNAQALSKGFTGPHFGDRLHHMPLFTMAIREQKLAPGSRSGQHRHYMEAIFYIMEGEGYEIHDGVKYPWQAGDFMCVPTFCIHQHFNAKADQWARLFYSVPLLFDFMGISSIEQIEVHSGYRLPEEAEISYSSSGQVESYRAGSLKLKVGADDKLQALMEAKKSALSVEKPRDTYDHFLRTIGEQTRWRQSVPHVVKSQNVPWEDTRMGRIKYVISPYAPAPLLLYDAFLQEIPPGGRSGKHRHVSEEVHKILSGRGYDIHDGVRWDWQEEDVVGIPVNTVHQHFNADPHRPASFVAFQSRLYHYIGHGGFEHLEDAPEFRP